MEPSSGRLPGLEATRPHMEPRATCSAAAPLVERQFRVLVGVTGSVAALKLPLLVSRLLDIPGPHVVWGVGVGETAHVGRAVEPPSIRLCGGAHIPLILWVDSSPESLDLLSGVLVRCCGYDSVLPLQGAQVRSLIGELRSLQLYIRWAVGDSFLGSPSDREVKRLHLVRPDLRVTAELEVAVVTTERAKHFYSPQDVPVTLYSDADEWEMWKCRSDPVLHIDLRRWADLMLVAPLDANTLGKVASGICDNLLFMGCPQHALLLVSLPSPVACPPYLCLPTRTWISTWTCVIRAWDRSKPLLFCPAMNTAMWEHPVTEQQVGQLKAFGYVEIPCVVKKLVCGDQGLGAMAEVGTIVDKVKEVLSQHGGFQQN
ncbi:hypothetical protein J1605_021345 [Eschrichtius robustus]|uniref:Flavoprotein domain-containing protein n=1 Tax=Eschrichtius robustus TaxID=9764 RepID=A0AB34HDZ4_ESCRO|nr:hypothetical protein J1605_021345 [Eschrichtius robustus]